MVDKIGHANNFNALRLLFASLVLLSHSSELVDGNRGREILTFIFSTLSFGEFAVDCFFILSGYLIVQSWDSDQSVQKFLTKRIFRIYPAFILCSLICGLVLGPIAATSSNYFYQFSVEDFVVGMLQLHQPNIPSIFSGSFYPAINSSMWTIVYEFRCYLIILLLGALGFYNWRMRFFPVILFITFISLDFLVFSKPDMKLYEFFFLEPHLRLDVCFILGSLFYLYQERIKYNFKYLFFSVIFLIFFMFSRELCDLGVAIFGSYIIFWCGFAKLNFLNKFQQAPDVSYGVYLYGWPIQKSIIWFLHVHSPWFVFLLSFPLSLFMGYISFIFIEQPAMNFRRKILKSTKVCSA